ncbi:MAG: hypothetical protein ACRDHY_12595 [Anaerolineales bacterium]
MATWIRCHANGDTRRDISDPIASLTFQFSGSDAPGCLASLDCNGDGASDITDPIFDLSFQFPAGPPPAPPYPACDSFAGCAVNCP